MAAPWGWIIAGIAAVTAAFYAAWKASPAQQFKEAQEAATKAGEAAQEVADKYGNLKSSLEELKDKRTALDDLTEGTREWKDAVFELNQQMLELMKTYPQLSGFIDNEGGVLTIDYDKVINDKTFDDAINDIYLNTFKASAAAAGAEIYANEKEIDYKASQLKIESGASEYLGKAIAEGLLVLTNDEEDNKTHIKEQLKNAGFLDNQAEALAERYVKEIDALEAYGNEVRNITAETETYKKTISAQSDLLANLKEKGYSKEDSEAASNYAKHISNTVFEKASGNRQFGLDKTINEQLAKDYADIMGYELKNLRIAGMSAVFTKEDGTKEKVTRKQIEEQLAAVDSTELLAKKQEEFVKQLNKLTPLIKNIYSGLNGENLTLENLNSVSSIEWKNGIEEAEKKQLETKASEIWW
jgi:hypothetical protein